MARIDPAAWRRELPASTSGVLVGLSGGLDSIALTQLLASAPGFEGRIRALHVHHGLHPDADRWAAHCQQACAGFGIPLTIARVAVERDGGRGPEGAAREARHAAFRAELRRDE